MSDVPADIEAAFNALIAERGGPGAFNDFQLDLALAVAGMVRDMHRVGSVEKARIADAVARATAAVTCHPRARRASLL